MKTLKAGHYPAAIDIAHAQQGEQAKQLWIKAEQLIGKPKVARWSDQHVEALQSLAAALAHAQQWRWTEEVINRTGKGLSHAKMLSELGFALAHAQQKYNGPRKRDSERGLCKIQ